MWTVCKEIIKFPRMDYINDYNNEMGNVDIVDHLRNIYRFDHWLRKKWWWSILFWAIGVMRVNAYIVYVKINERDSAPKNAVFYHHDFRNKVAMEWINPELYWLIDRNDPAMSNWKKRKSMASDASSEISKKFRTTQVSENSLKPYGPLCIRVDTSWSCFPESTQGKVRYYLHKLLGIETQKFITVYRSYNVNICKE